MSYNAEKEYTRAERLELLEDANRRLASTEELKKADASAHSDTIKDIKKEIKDILRDLRANQ